MHELSIALSIVDVAAEEAARRGVKVAAVHLRLGPLSGVVKEALLSAWELAREGTALEGAGLKVEETPLLAKCPKCETTRPVVSVQWLCCAECGTPTPEVVSGRELEVAALEVGEP
jgi:hydrogenase nickel incorporation protein HypA/HybF